MKDKEEIMRELETLLNKPNHDKQETLNHMYMSYLMGYRDFAEEGSEAIGNLNGNLKRDMFRNF